MNWKTIVFVAITSIGLTLLAVKFLNKPTSPKPSVNYGQLIQIEELNLLKQTNNYSELTMQQYKFRVLGSTQLYCEWEATYFFGLDNLSEWNWNTKYNKEEKIYRVTAPKIKFLRADLQPVKCKTIKKGLFVNHDQYRNEIEEKFQNEAEEDGKSKVVDSEVQRLGKLSLESHLLSILRDANPNEPATRVVVSFIDNEDS